MLILFCKAHVKAHTRRLKNGKVISIAAYSDKRIKQSQQDVLSGELFESLSSRHHVVRQTVRAAPHLHPVRNAIVLFQTDFFKKKPLDGEQIVQQHSRRTPTPEPAHMTNPTPALPYDRESHESKIAYQNANKRLGTEGLYTLRISTSRYHIDHVERFEKPKYTVSKQPLNPRTGKPWQASREILETEDLNEALALIASRTQPVAPASQPESTPVTPAPEPTPNGVVSVATHRSDATLQLKVGPLFVKFRMVRDDDPEPGSGEVWNRGTVTSRLDTRPEQAAHLIAELRQRGAGFRFNTQQRNQIVAAFTSAAA
jgi:uncharacterized protein YciI